MTAEYLPLGFACKVSRRPADKVRMKLMISGLTQDKRHPAVVTGLVSWGHEGKHFPSSTWFDNVSTILSWWIVALSRSKGQAREVKMQFMEGQYEIKLERMPDAFYRAVSDDGLFCPSVRIAEVASEILRGTDYLLSEADVHNWKGIDADAWRRAQLRIRSMALGHEMGP